MDACIKKEHARKKAFRVLVYVLLAVWALWVLFPFYWMVLTSFKTYGDYSGESTPQLYTLAPTLENYAKAFTDVPLAQYFLNTLIFTLLTTGLMLVVTVLAAFAFARLNFKGKNLAFTLFLALMMIPAELVIITNYVTVTTFDLRDTFTGLVFGELDMIPGDGEQNIELDFKGLHIHITYVEEHQIARATIVKLDSADDDNQTEE